MTSDVLILHNAAGESDEEPFSESNAGVLEELDAVVAAIEVLGAAYEVKSIDAIEQLPDILDAAAHEVVFNLIEELPRDITDACYVPAICRLYGRPCTGNDTPALLLAQNKWHAKAILRAHNIPTPNSSLVACGRTIAPDELPPGRYVVKPAFSDASEGIDGDSIVDVPGKAIGRAVRRVHDAFGQPALVEEFIPCRELNVSVFERNGRVSVLPIAEIDFGAFDADTPKIVDYSAKWLVDSFAYNNTPRIIPAPLSDKTDALVREYAIGAWNALGCRDYVRVDFRTDEKGRPFVIEVNPNPDICPGDGFAAALEAAGITYEEFVRTLLENAESRQLQGRSASP
jgi:D-alanine-D-alanine ligase